MQIKKLKKKNNTLNKLNIFKLISPYNIKMSDEDSKYKSGSHILNLSPSQIDAIREPLIQG